MPLGYQKNFFGPDDPLPSNGWEAFYVWLAHNSDLVAAVEAYALEMVRFRPKYSIYAIIEHARWHMIVQKHGREEYLIDNNFRPYLVRFLIARNPQLRFFFELRASEADVAWAKPSNHAK
jgi:hypothetical protein